MKVDPLPVRAGNDKQVPDWIAGISESNWSRTCHTVRTLRPSSLCDHVNLANGETAICQTASGSRDEAEQPQSKLPAPSERLQPLPQPASLKTDWNLGTLIIEALAVATRCDSRLEYYRGVETRNAAQSQKGPAGQVRQPRSVWW